MCPNPQFPVDLVTFTEETLNGKLHFLFSVYAVQQLVRQLVLKVSISKEVAFALSLGHDTKMSKRLKIL